MLGDGDALGALLVEIRAIVREEVRSAHPQRYNYDDAAARLGVSPRTLRAHVDTGDLTPLRIGQRVLFTEEMLEAFERDAAAGRLRYRPRRAGRKAPGREPAAGGRTRAAGARATGAR